MKSFLSSNCVNLCEGYECQCQEGFFMNDDKDECCDENQCSNENTCKENAECVNLCVGFKCVCVDGYHKEKVKLIYN